MRGIPWACRTTKDAQTIRARREGRAIKRSFRSGHVCEGHSLGLQNYKRRTNDQGKEGGEGDNVPTLSARLQCTMEHRLFSRNRLQVKQVRWLYNGLSNCPRIPFGPADLSFVSNAVNCEPRHSESVACSRLSDGGQEENKKPRCKANRARLGGGSQSSPPPPAIFLSTIWEPGTGYRKRDARTSSVSSSLRHWCSERPGSSSAGV